MRLKEGDIVQVTSGAHDLHFAELVALECYKIGAIPTLSASTDQYSKRVLTEVPLKYLEATPKQMIALAEVLTARIIIEPYNDPGILAKVPEESIGARRRATKPVSDRMRERNVKWAYIGYPTRKTAKFYGINYEKFKNMFWEAMNINYKQLAEREEKVAKHLRGKNEIHLTTKKGTNLTFSIKNRQIQLDDGIISDKDMADRDPGLNLPTGEIFVAPIEDSANGVAVYDAPTYYKGLKIENLKLTYKDGKIVDARASRGLNVFKKALSHASGDKDKLGEFGMGMNPKVKEVIGYTLTDEKTIGTVHLALGENRHFPGGRNNSNIHWDILIHNPTIKVDREIIMKEGKFTV
jgi:aminopeptidase